MKVKKPRAIRDEECGRMPIIISNGKGYRVVCPACSKGSPTKKLENEAIEAWNNDHILYGNVLVGKEGKSH